MYLFINAFEASAVGEEVICVIEKSRKEIIFIINNPAFINPDIQCRIFQQFFPQKRVTGEVSERSELN